MKANIPQIAVRLYQGTDFIPTQDTSGFPFAGIGFSQVDGSLRSVVDSFFSNDPSRPFWNLLTTMRTNSQDPRSFYTNHPDDPNSPLKLRYKVPSGIPLEISEAIDPQQRCEAGRFVTHSLIQPFKETDVKRHFVNHGFQFRHERAGIGVLFAENDSSQVEYTVSVDQIPMARAELSLPNSAQILFTDLERELQDPAKIMLLGIYALHEKNSNDSKLILKINNKEFPYNLTAADVSEEGDLLKQWFLQNQNEILRALAKRDSIQVLTSDSDISFRFRFSRKSQTLYFSQSLGNQGATMDPALVVSSLQTLFVQTIQSIYQRRLDELGLAIPAKINALFNC